MLRHLNLELNELTDAGSEHLRQLERVERIHLGRNDISDAGLGCLERMVH